LYRRTKARIYDKVKKSQEETPKRDTQSASPDIIAARRNDRVLLVTLVKRRIKVLNVQIEEDQKREKGNNDSFTQGRVNERATDAKTKTLAR
jgi:hypothetical protein